MDLRGEFVKSFKRVNTTVVPIVAGPMSIRGIPDLRVIHRRFRLWVEIKKKDSIRSTQQTMMEDMYIRGESVAVAVLSVYEGIPNARFHSWMDNDLGLTTMIGPDRQWWNASQFLDCMANVVRHPLVSLRTKEIIVC